MVVQLCTTQPPSAVLKTNINKKPENESEFFGIQKSIEHECDDLIRKCITPFVPISWRRPSGIHSSDHPNDEIVRAKITMFLNSRLFHRHCFLK